MYLSNSVAFSSFSCCFFSVFSIFYIFFFCVCAPKGKATSLPQLYIPQAATLAETALSLSFSLALAWCFFLNAVLTMFYLVLALINLVTHCCCWLVVVFHYLRLVKCRKFSSNHWLKKDARLAVGGCESFVVK